jgi:hypothetical protein
VQLSSASYTSIKPYMQQYRHKIERQNPEVKQPKYLYFLPSGNPILWEQKDKATKIVELEGTQSIRDYIGDQCQRCTR